jgi:hypothetical protein
MPSSVVHRSAEQIKGRTHIVVVHMHLRPPAHNRGESLTRAEFEASEHRLRRPSPLVSSLVLDDTWQHGPTRDGLSSQVSGTARHDATPDGRPCQTTQIYEGTNQIQRMVIAKKLFS